jgi:hypothetical protein
MSARVSNGTWTEHIEEVVKGTFVALALVVATSRSEDALTSGLAIVGALLAVVLAELYGLVLEAEIHQRRRLSAADIRAIGTELMFIMLGGVPALILLGLAAVDVIGDDTAVDVIVWSGIGFLGVLGFLAGRRAGRSISGALGYALALALIGALVLVIKVVF